MKKLSVFLCAVLLCSCAPTDYISVVPEESVSGAVMSSVVPEPPDGTEKDFTEPTSYIPDSTSGGDAQTEKPPETTAVREPGKITVTYLTENVKKAAGQRFPSPARRESLTASPYIIPRLSPPQRVLSRKAPTATGTSAGAGA